MARQNADHERVRGEEEITRLLAPLTLGDPGTFALKDDCALLTPEAGKDLVLKTDPVVEGIHFLPSDVPQDIAWKALAVNVSDLAAKAATPIGYLMALSFPEPPRAGWMRAFVAGLKEAQTKFGCHLLGGDTDRRPGPVTISITAFGYVPRDGMIRRGSARAGDALFVSGTVGDACLGLELMKDPGLQAVWGLTEPQAAWLRHRYARPQPRLELADALRQYASAAMDVSDGLIKDLERMLHASGLAGRLAAYTVPLSGAARRVAESAPETLPRLITAGDDYEVLAAVPQAHAAAFAHAVAGSGGAVTRIGEFLAGAPVLSVVGGDGLQLALPEKHGWDHF